MHGGRPASGTHAVVQIMVIIDDDIYVQIAMLPAAAAAAGMP